MGDKKFFLDLVIFIKKKFFFRSGSIDVPYPPGHHPNVGKPLSLGFRPRERTRVVVPETRLD
jgi:hypothetical protein